jgi:RND family efflux transporter MFP subunit
METTKSNNYMDENTIQQHGMAKVPAVQTYLESICTRTNDILEGAVLMLNQKDSNLNKLAQWPETRGLSLAMSNTANAAIKRATSLKIIPAISTNEDNEACIIAAPLIANNVIVGVIVLALKTANNKESTERLASLQEIAPILTSLVISNLGASRPADANKLLQLQTVFLSKSSLNDSATAFANELSNLLKLRRVSIGLMIKQQIQMIAISNNTDFKQQQSLIVSMSAAMEEAADQTESVLYPAHVDQTPRITIAHKAMFNLTQNPVCSTPLIHQGKVIGVISLEHEDATVVHKEAIIWYEHIANFLAPLLALKQSAEQSWYQRAITHIKNKRDTFFSQDNVVTNTSIAIGLVTICAMGFIPVSYHVGARAHIEGATQRIVAAPVDGFIHNAKVRPGDLVKKGDLLIELSDQDLILEKEKWESEIIQQENNFSGALARQDRTQYAISQAKAMQARAELALINQSIARSHIIAPIDGVVLEGDLSQSLGAPVSIGENLMTLAPKDQYRLIINVDERDIKDIQQKQKGTLALSAYPANKIHFTVERITPMATVKDGQNVYEVEATLTDKALYLRPGLQGVAKIAAGEKPIIWSLSHRIIDWLKLTLWKWGI